MKTKNLISSLLCGLFLFSGQQAYANTYHPNQSNTPANGLNYIQTDVVKLAKKSAKDENKAKDIVKDVKKDNDSAKDEDKVVVKNDDKDVAKDDHKDVVKNDEKDVAKDENKGKDTVKDVKKDNDSAKDEDKVVVKNDDKDVAKDENKGKDTVKDDVKDNSEDGTNPLSFENLVTHNEDGNDHCKSKKGNECNEGDDEDSHHNDDDDDEHEISPVPIPGAIWLFGTALVGFVSMNSRRKV